MNTTTKTAEKMTKAELIGLLADYYVRVYPAIYAGYRADAVVFWQRHGGTKADLVMAVLVRGLVRS